MPELILELYTEEIPAFMQKKAEEAYYTIFTNAFLEAEISYSTLAVHVGPRRLVLHVSQLPIKSLAQHIALRGPKVASPEQAIEGFCKNNNIIKSDLIIQSVKDQDHYVYEFLKPAIDLPQILPNLLSKAISEYIWPKSMYWGSYEMKWVRPMLNVMCLFDGKILDFSYFHLKANDRSFGHRFISQDSFAVSDWGGYVSHLKKAYVMLERSKRSDIIVRGIEVIQEEKNLIVDIDSRLLEEVAGIVEYPNVLIGNIPETFMQVPSEILGLAMKTHQRYFTTRAQDGTFAPYFVFVTNLPGSAEDVVRGNEKVLSARLSDAAYFYIQDQKTPLASRLAKLKEVMFHAKLGSLYDKTTRLVNLVQYLKPNDKTLAQAALLCKCDLVTEAVTEFPELQGIMGGYYSALDGCLDDVSLAIRNHYLPLGNNDDLPTGPAAFLALADKMDSLVSLMYAGEQATGSKDPYALRRYALGIIKIILQNKIEGLEVKGLIASSSKILLSAFPTLRDESIAEDDIVKFIEERFKYLLKDKYDIGAINAVVDLFLNDDLYVTEMKVRILHNFMSDERGEILLQLYKRVTNILGNAKITHNVDTSKFVTNEELNLYDAIQEVAPKVTARLEAKDFEHALGFLNVLGDPIAQFFDKVLVNDPDCAVAQNRRSLLFLISDIFNYIARFEKL